jgi:hypothetical protein
MLTSNPRTGDSAAAAKLVAAWVFVGIPLLWGISVTVVNASALFK